MKSKDIELPEFRLKVGVRYTLKIDRRRKYSFFKRKPVKCVREVDLAVLRADPHIEEIIKPKPIPKPAPSVAEVLEVIEAIEDIEEAACVEEKKPKKSKKGKSKKGVGKKKEEK